MRYLLLLTLLLTATASSVLAEPNDGSVTGQLLNKTAGGAAAAGAQVSLIAFGRKEQAPVSQQNTQTDGQGQYSFNSLDRDPNLVYITLARFQNVNYPTGQPFQLQEQASFRADIDVYDATGADDAIQLERLNLLIMGAQDGMLQFMEMGALINTGDRTFVTANPQDGALARAIKFALPSGALGVQMQTGFNNQDVTAGVGGVQVTSPVPPGRHEFALSFQVPYSGASADVSLQLPYPTSTYSVYVPETGLKLDARKLSQAGPTQLGGQSYVLYSATDLPRAALVDASLQLSGGAAGGMVAPNQLGLISLGVILLVLAAGVALFGARLRPAGYGAERRLAGNSATERLELVVRLAALDERFAAGDLSHSEYEAERDRGKQRLRELTLAQRPTVSSAV